MKKVLKLLVFLFLLIAVIAILIAISVFKKANSVCRHESITVSTVLPTCTSEGKTLHSCNNCSYYYITDPIPPTQHKYSPRIIEPTCSTEGYTFYFCSCGDFYQGENTPMLEHSFADKTITASCSAGGYVEHTCTSCGYSYKDNPTPTAPHDYISKTYLPTALEVGYTEHVCSCSISYKDSFISYSEILDSPYPDTSTVFSRGIDVSRWNHQIDPVNGEYLPLDWQRIKSAGFDFVIIKAGSTRSGKEPTFEMDYAGAHAAGLDVGAYFYTYSPTVDGIKNDVMHRPCTGPIDQHDGHHR